MNEVREKGYQSAQGHAYYSMFDIDLVKEQISRLNDRANRVIDGSRRGELLAQARVLNQALVYLSEGLKKAQYDIGASAKPARLSPFTPHKAYRMAPMPVTTLAREVVRTRRPVIPGPRKANTEDTAMVVQFAEFAEIKEDLIELSQDATALAKLAELKLPVLEPFVHELSTGNKVIIVTTANVRPHGASEEDTEFLGGAINEHTISKDCFEKLGRLLVEDLDERGKVLRVSCPFRGDKMGGFAHFYVLRPVDGTTMRFWHTTPGDRDKRKEHRVVKVDKAGNVKVIKGRKS